MRPGRPGHVPPGHSCPGPPARHPRHRDSADVPDLWISRLGRTLREWKTTILAYFDTDGASNGGTEAANGLIELGRRSARGFRAFDHYRRRRLLITGGLDASPHTQL